MDTVARESSGGRYGGLVMSEYPDKPVQHPGRSRGSLCEEELEMS